jgi:hypothetical protein
MKLTIIFALVGLISVFFACDNPVSLGSRLDVDGPVVEFTSPVPRKAVVSGFSMEGNIRDYSGVKLMVLRTMTNGIEFPKQWRYNMGSWEISEDHGVSWKALEGAEWEGTTKSAVWKIPIDMIINGADPEDGEYVFSIEAWDVSNMSDDNSYKTLVLIFDSNPPKVEITNPSLYWSSINNGTFSNAELQRYHEFDDNGNDWKDPSLIGKFLTQDFQMQWQIEDNHDIWSIDIRFYEHDAEGIDDKPETSLPDTQIYRYHINLPPPPPVPDPNSNIKPNGKVMVPDLAGPTGEYDGGGRLQKSIAEKTVVRVVASCYDAAGNPNQEKTLGYFVYWPKADYPWITYAEGMEEDYDDLADAYMVYPGRNIKVTAFHAQGLKNVKYWVYSYDEENLVLGELRGSGTIENPPRASGAYSTIFPWEFTPPPSTSYYMVKAIAYSDRDKESDEYTALFRVQDITFPDFPEPPDPPASDPLYMSMDNNTITIKGEVRDATAIKNLSMVWINPKSKNYAAMAQLAYFRDSNYAGWLYALDKLGEIEPGETFEESGSWVYDSVSPNLLWNIKTEYIGEDEETRRQVYRYSQTINLEDMDIGIRKLVNRDSGINIEDKQPLTNQIFLLRAENPDGKCTIITYAPQGDTSPPSVTIDRVEISRSNAPTIVCEPGKYAVIPIFEDGDTITVYGNWREDSTGYLDITDYLAPNLRATVNGRPLTKAIYPANGNATSGTFTFTGTAGGNLTTENLRDAIVVAVEVEDIGGNPSEAGASWLVQNDRLRLLRISSEDLDATYKVGDEITIFLEFSKPVRRKVGSPVLTLNTGGTAVYSEGQLMENTRQYFTYTVGSGHNTTAPDLYLNVTGIQGYDDDAWKTDTYPFTFVNTVTGGATEEIRITMSPEHDGTELLREGSSSFYARVLPTNPNDNVTVNPDYSYTLIAGKHIVIDTTPPTVSRITATPAGWHGEGAVLSISVTFSKPVKIGSTTPYLTLGTGQTAGNRNRTDTTNVRVSGETITFMYQVKDGDNTNGNNLEITGSGGVITDIVGTALSGRITGILSGIVLDTTTPSVPTVNIIRTGTVTVGTSGGTGVAPWNPSSYLTSAAFNANYPNITPLLNQYWDDLSIQISPSGTGDDDRWTTEYSIDYGKNWNSLPAADETIVLNTNGSYDVTARQTDRAGNVSQWSRPVTFVWDKGSLVTRIDATNANGTYTNNGGSRRDIIDITVYFRKQLKFSSAPSITLNVTPATVTVTANGYSLNSEVQQLNFRYTVGTNHNTPVDTPLAVTGLTGGFSTAQDADNTSVSTHVTLQDVSLLQDNKNIRIQTGALTNDPPAFVDTALSDNGGVQTDGSYHTALVIDFNRAIYKGTGSITIIQSNTNYRLPAVLTEAQSNRFRDIENFGNYYTRGTNGYDYTSETERGADTSTKYILRYNIDTAAAANAPNASAPENTVPKLAADFRNAERVSLSVNSQAMRIDGSKLIVELTGSNALQVPGATYIVEYPAGLVQDALSYQCTAAVNQSLSIGGVAKPFVRINKKQDVLTAQAGDANNPRLTVAQPFQAEISMDCRTPGSTIYYFVNQEVTTTNAVNWGTGVGTNGNGTTGENTYPYDGPSDTSNPPAPALPNDPEDAGRVTYNDPFSIGNDNEYQGLQWFVRAKASTGEAWSTDSYEMAFRTVITYMYSLAYSAADGQAFGNGDQLWIRGGDGIGSSSVPGFPLTWSDDWNNLNGKRAGIRLMQKTSTGTLVAANATWRWVSWEINTTAYVNFILGRDAASSVQEAWLYGPREWAYQRAGWSSFTEKYPIYPGKHRYLNVSVDRANKGAMNFEAGFPQKRPLNLPVDYPNVNQP